MLEKNKSIYHRFILILSIALLIGFAYYLKKNSSHFEQIKSLDLSLVFFLVCIHFIHFFLLGVTHFYPLRKHNIFLGFKEWYGLCTISELFNVLLPAKGGTAIRMMYIHDKKGLALRDFLSMGLAVTLAGFSLLGVLGFAYCQFLLKKHNLVFNALESLFIALTISAVILIFTSELFTKIFKKQRKYSLKKYLVDKKLMIVSSLCYLGMFLLYPIKIYLSFKTVGVNIHFFDSFEISLILITSSFFQILPGNIGIKEMATAYVAQQYGIQFEIAFLASLIDRAILLLFLFPFGAYFYWDLFLEGSLANIRLSFTKPKLEAQTSP